MVHLPISCILLQVDGTSGLIGAMEFREHEFSIPIQQEFNEGLTVTIFKL